MKFTNIFAFIALIAFIAACSGQSGNQQEATEQEEATQPQGAMQEGGNQSAVRTINLIAIDAMKYAVTENSDGITVGDAVGSNGNLLALKSITVSPGQQVHIVLTTRSQLPASAMSHNWILLKQSADPDAFDQAALQAKDNDYIPSDMTDQIIAHVPLTSGGETHEVTFTAPEQTGEYTYLCSFPGHYNAGMTGTFTVQ